MAYFDHCATTPLDARVFEAMQPWLGEHFGNPSSVHRYGRAARAAIDIARQQVADFAGVIPEQVIFTTSGTTANNLALLGYLNQDPGRSLLLSRMEHSSVQSVAESRADRLNTVWLATDSAGRVLVSPDQLRQARRADLLAVMLANNETGVIEPVEQIAEQAREYGLRLHCDAVQAAGKMPISFDELGVDSLSIAAHKFYGSVGAAALLVKNIADLDPIIYGGGHERGLFSGTENTAAIVGLGVACQLASKEIDQRRAHISGLQRKLEDSLRSDFQAHIFSTEAERIPGVTMFAIPNIHGELLVMHCDREGFAISSGSACHSMVTRPSPVLRSMGVDDQLSLSAVRLSLGKDNTSAELDAFLIKLRKILSELVLDYGT